MTAYRKSVRVLALASAAWVASMPALAWAQDDARNNGDDQEIIVTGTLLKGAEPVGQGVILRGPEEAQAQGAATSNEILATIPQVTNLFVTVPNSRLGVATNQIQVIRPNLRNLSPETGSSASTLVLFDGHRLAGAGVTQSSVDPDLVPQLAIERVEVVTDGGSATYGADAVGGVINFVTRKRFDGVRADARYGFGDDYWTVDANAIVGNDWGSGSLYAAYSFQKNNSFLGSDRDFIRSIDWTTGIPVGRSCNPGNVTVGLTNYSLPNLTAGGVNACDPTDDSTAFPAAERHSATAALHQELTSGLTLDLRAFWAQRTSDGNGPLRGQATVTTANVNYRPVTPGSTANQTVSFTLAPLFGNESAPSHSGFNEWGVNGEVTAELGSSWEFRGLLNYSQSSSAFYNVGLNQAVLGSVAARQVNFYDPAASSAAGLAVINQIANGEISGQARDQYFQARGILAGTLFNLPGGEVRVAAGYEYLDDSFKQRTNPPNGMIGAIDGQPWVPYKRNAHAVFGELQVPIFGADNRIGGFYSLVLSGALRYDHFSDFGSTTNPKVGVDWKPVSWLTLKGNYSTSFNAPSPVDQLGSLRNSVTFFPLNAFVNPAHTGANAPVVVGAIALQGATPGLIPQTAKTWSIGGDIEPPFIPGLRAGLSYYSVDFKDLLNIPSPNSTIFTNFPNNVTADPLGLTVAQILTFRDLAPGAPTTIDNVIAGRCATPAVLNSRCNVYELVDFRSGNFGTLNVRGLDFNVNYRTGTGFGGIDASVSGNYQLSRKSRVSPTAATITDELLFNTPKLIMQATLGADIGNFRTQLTLNHVSGYDVQRTATFPQDKVSSFDIFNLFFRYNVPGESMLLKDLSLTLNVNNVFDTDPPVFKSFAVGQGNGYPQGQFTLGRVIMFGVSKKF